MKKALWSLFESLEFIFVAAIGVYIIRTFIMQPFLVGGSSMEPNFQTGNYLIVDELTYFFKSPQRGDVIVFRFPNDPREYFIKRIIGLPGEQVKIQGGIVQIYKNGVLQHINENYMKVPTPGNLDVVLKNNQYFVMGDNRNASYDSRAWGPLDSKYIVGLVRFRLWPLNEVMAFN
ncbi:MAG: signal peptidase I [Minisyncoccia bacterium]